MGYYRAGFDVVGVDLKRTGFYPFEFIQADVFELELDFLKGFDFIHASPCCQAYSRIAFNHILRGKKFYPQQIDPVRDLLISSGVPYVIENVPGSPLKNYFTLCGTSFGLRILRHRIFESSIDIGLVPPCNHQGSVIKGDYIQVCGNGSLVGSNSKKRGAVRFKYADSIKTAWSMGLGIDWMDVKSMSQAIPPIYTEFIGKRILGVIN